MDSRKVDTIINAGTLLTVNRQNDVLYDTIVVICDGLIVDICHKSKQNKYIADRVISAEDSIVMPGFINTHTHIPMSYFKGLADDYPLETWLQKYIWPTEARCINPTFIYEASLHGIGELIKNGITMFNDMYFIPAETARACHKAGIRAKLCSIGLDFPMGNFFHPDMSFVSVDSILDSKLIDFCIGPHSVYVASQKTWERAISLAREKNLHIHTHLCETKTEVKNCISQTDRTPVKYLYDLGAFQSKFVMAHGVHLTEEDMDILADSDCSLAMNLHSNLKLASGIPPIALYLKHNINISIGTDSVASNNTLSISDEIATAGRLYKTIYDDPTFLPAADLVRMGTINGAKALGVENVTGSIEIGKSADIICIDVGNFQSQPNFNPFSTIVYGMNRELITDVMVNGRVLMSDRKLTTIDEAELYANARQNLKLIQMEA
jgi:5-methylthioadenosine/S-adenosylhomocysteine deaminase